MSPLDTASFPVPYEWGVEPDAAAVPPARRLIVDIARFWRVPLSDDALRDVELCAGELLANVVEHAKARCMVTVRWTGLRLRVEVTDTSPHPPDSSATVDTVTGGRGLLLVAGLAHSWGWSPAGAGKVVWFEVAADQLVTGEERLAVLVNTAHAQVTDQLSRSS
ncbi:ATP-binding protein [Kitasatospora sp. NBC_01287]|uniref:ATP-binding protein n=1 Tax=Kitasatospora sp. NBC_01287 TaxID=2903573 RepID=UPI00225442F2|nr:ATP-binding protein [Kitasatospora sp. NBC_01287]MCX4747756.1 ATP-binding protein [Kitasatospora sp. NBC_01287]